MPPCERISLRMATPLDASEAARLRDDADLRQGYAEHGLDLDAAIELLKLEPEGRLASLGEENIVRVIDELGRRGARYVLIGGLAARVYGSIHATSDVDVCHARDRRNLSLLASLLRDVDAEFRRAPRFAPAVIEGTTFATETDFVFTSRLGKIDLIGEFTGVGRYADASLDAITVTLAGRSVPVLALPKLIASKRSTGRPKDQVVAAELELLSQARCRAEPASTAPT